MSNGDIVALIILLITIPYGIYAKKKSKIFKGTHKYYDLSDHIMVPFGIPEKLEGRYGCNCSGCSNDSASFAMFGIAIATIFLWAVVELMQ